MSRSNPTEAQLARKAAQKASKVKQMQMRRDYLTSVGCAIDHDFQPWDCGCSWGCEMCKYSKCCSRCNSYV